MCTLRGITGLQDIFTVILLPSVYVMEVNQAWRWAYKVTSESLNHETLHSVLADESDPVILTSRNTMVSLC